MNITFPFTTCTLKRSLYGALSILAIAPMLYFAACSSSDDNGGGAPPGSPPGGGGSTANQFAYVIAAGAGEIQAYNLDNSGNLNAIGGRVATGSDPHHVDVDRAGRFVYVSNHESPFVSGWRINQDGSLDPINPAITGSPVTPDVNPHSSVIDQSGSFLYVVSGTGASTLTAYTIDTSNGPTRGTPTPIAGQSFAVGTHAHNVTISPNNQFLYVAAEDSNEVHAFSRDTTTGMLTARNVITGLTECDAVVVSNDNRFLFAAYTNAVEVMSIDQSTGALTRITPVSAFGTNNVGGGTSPHSIALRPDGQTLYTGNLNGNSVSVFRVDTNTGALTELQSPPVPTGLEPNYVVVHPNGNFLFTADQGPDQVSRFNINGDGTLVSPATVIPNTGSGTNGIGTTKF
jgi:6-phosphogluconolactonase (cycloisomerase 2 family)